MLVERLDSDLSPTFDGESMQTWLYPASEARLEYGYSLFQRREREFLAKKSKFRPAWHSRAPPPDLRPLSKVTSDAVRSCSGFVSIFLQCSVKAVA